MLIIPSIHTQYIDRDNATKEPMKNMQSSSIYKSEVRVVTFDLDNTIWKTGAVISSANDALANHLDSIGINTPVRVEKIMGQLFMNNKAKYSPVLAQDHQNEKGDGNLDHIKVPVLLTELRKDAVMEILLNQTVELEHDLEHLTEEAFQVWTGARHAAIPSNFASYLLEGLREIRQLKTKYGKHVVVGAITDGNSDPRKVELLEEYFDFVVNAESVGISKPDRRIYDAAISFVFSDPRFNHVFDDDSNDNDFDVLLDKFLPWWVHIGDDFVKDIVAAKDMKMRSIWCRELVMDKLPKEITRQEPQKTEEEFRKAMAEKKVLSMIIGSDDYLLNGLQDEFADAIVDDFSLVAKVISSWHEEGMQSTLSEANEVDLPDYFSIVLPEEKEEVQPASPQEQGNASDTATAQVKPDKFCVECGDKLPRAAKFCSSCGNKQPELSN